MTACAHLDMIHEVKPSADGCEECRKTGSWWVHLRMCMTCGYVGCCDSSPSTHAARHATAVDHPLVRSLEAGEEWLWCYADQVYLTPRA